MCGAGEAVSRAGCGPDVHFCESTRGGGSIGRVDAKQRTCCRSASWRRYGSEEARNDAAGVPRGEDEGVDLDGCVGTWDRCDGCDTGGEFRLADGRKEVCRGWSTECEE